MTRRTTARRPGFSTVELIIATSLAVVVLAACLMMFVAQQRTYWRQRLINEMQQTARAAVDVLGRDVRTAGYGVPIDASDLGNWITWTTNVNDFITVEQGSTASDPDRVTLVGAFDEPESTLAQAASVGATSIRVQTADAGAFDAGSRSLVFVGRTELARITSKASSTLNISTTSSGPAAGLANDYPAGAPVELVKAVTYSCRLSVTGFPYRPFLMRDDNTGTFGSDLQKMVAIGIDDLQATATNGTLVVSIRSRAKDADGAYTDPETGDGYHRTRVSTTLSARNL
jgi:Tfp pilus assembly protein PilW